MTAGGTVVDPHDPEVVSHPLDGFLDLHQFRPEDARDVVGDYLDACREAGVLDVRIVHGKGKGVLRRIVHSLLQERDDVEAFRLAADAGGWGATLVRLIGDRAATGGGAVLALGLGVLLLAACGCGGGPTPEGVAPPAAAGTAEPADGGMAAGALAATAPAEEPEAVSLLGAPLYRPLLPALRRELLETDLEAARNVYEADLDGEEAIIWYGRRLAYLGRYREAIAVYGRGLGIHPDSYALRRHRGHRYITVRDFDAAVADLEAARTLLGGRKPEIEPDGAPNALGIPLSNGHFSVLYHLGLAHYLRGDFEAARDAYFECMRYADNDDLRVAVSDWLWMTYRRLGRDAEAAALLEPIEAGMQIIENDAYHRRLLMYKGELAPEALLQEADRDDPDAALAVATQGYGVGNWYLVNGDEERGFAVFERVLAGTSWAAFGYIAAEAEMARRRR